MHSTAAATIGGSPSASINFNHHQYQQQQPHQTQYDQINHHPQISSPTQQNQSHLHHQHHNHNHHQLVSRILSQVQSKIISANVYVSFSINVNFCLIKKFNPIVIGNVSIESTFSVWIKGIT